MCGGPGDWEGQCAFERLSSGPGGLTDQEVEEEDERDDHVDEVGEEKEDRVDLRYAGSEVWRRSASGMRVGVMTSSKCDVWRTNDSDRELAGGAWSYLWRE